MPQTRQKTSPVVERYKGWGKIIDSKEEMWRCSEPMSDFYEVMTRLHPPTTTEEFDSLFKEINQGLKGHGFYLNNDDQNNILDRFWEMLEDRIDDKIDSYTHDIKQVARMIAVVAKKLNRPGRPMAERLCGLEWTDLVEIFPPSFV